MKSVRSYPHEFNLVITTTPEELNDQNLLEQVKKLNRETAGISDLKEIGDCHNLEDVSKLTVEATIRAGSSENDGPGSLFALLIPDNKLVFGLARACQTFAEDRRKSVMIFAGIEKALEWLSLCEEAKVKVGKMLKSA